MATNVLKLWIKIQTKYFKNDDALNDILTILE